MSRRHAPRATTPVPEGAHTCPCGQPAPDTHVCADCEATMRTNLHKLADRWPELERALTMPAAAPIHLTRTPGSEDNTGNATGIDLNEQITRSRTLVAGLAWFIVGVLRDDYDDMGRDFHAPADQSVPSLLRWIERWHLTHLLRHGIEETAHELRTDLATAERRTYNALNATRTIYVGIPCTEHDTSDMGERIPCPGEMTARVVPGVMPDLVCTVDPRHTIAPSRWERDGWRGRFARPMNAGALDRLRRAVGTR